MPTKQDYNSKVIEHDIRELEKKRKRKELQDSIDSWLAYGTTKIGGFGMTGVGVSEWFSPELISTLSMSGQDAATLMGAGLGVLGAKGLKTIVVKVLK